MNLKASLLEHVITLRGYGSGWSRVTIKPLKNISHYSVQYDIKERISLWRTLRLYWRIRLSVPLPLPLPLPLPVKSKAGISDWRAVRFVEKLRRPPGTRNYTQRMSRAISSTWLSHWLCLAPPLSLLSPPILCFWCCFSMALKLHHSLEKQSMSCLLKILYPFSANE